MSSTSRRHAGNADRERIGNEYLGRLARRRR